MVLVGLFLLGIAILILELGELVQLVGQLEPFVEIFGVGCNCAFHWPSGATCWESEGATILHWFDCLSSYAYLFDLEMTF